MVQGSTSRSAVMSKIKSKDTEPELIVRKLLHKHGFRYRLHANKLPGKPDIVLPKYKSVIFINGCFWHFHNCSIGHLPKSNQEYWIPKLKRNQERDLDNKKQYKDMGWKVLTVWECAITGQNKITNKKLIQLLSKSIKLGTKNLEITSEI